MLFGEAFGGLFRRIISLTLRDLIFSILLRLPISPTPADLLLQLVLLQLEYFLNLIFCFLLDFLLSDCWRLLRNQWAGGTPRKSGDDRLFSIVENIAFC